MAVGEKTEKMRVASSYESKPCPPMVPAPIRTSRRIFLSATSRSVGQANGWDQGIRGRVTGRHASLSSLHPFRCTASPPPLHWRTVCEAPRFVDNAICAFANLLQNLKPCAVFSQARLGHQPPVHLSLLFSLSFQLTSLCLLRLSLSVFVSLLRSPVSALRFAVTLLASRVARDLFVFGSALSCAGQHKSDGDWL